MVGTGASRRGSARCVFVGASSNPASTTTKPPAGYLYPTHRGRYKRGPGPRRSGHSASARECSSREASLGGAERCPAFRRGCQRTRGCVSGSSRADRVDARAATAGPSGACDGDDSWF
eukprot:Rmarinus@m.29173